jgi:hypothetical protein
MSRNVKEQIIEQVERLGEPERRQVLDFARRLKAPAGTPGRALLRFAGCVAAADLQAMSQAIQEGCEKADPNAW